MPLKAVLFDIDGTLVDSNEQHVVAWAFAFREAGHRQELDTIRAQIGKGGDLLVPTILPDADTALCDNIAEQHGRLFKTAYLDGVRAFPAASALIRKTRSRGLDVVLASSAKQDELDHYVDLLGIADCLAATTCMDDVERSKPEPDIFGVAIAKIGIEPADAIVVGDTPYDVEAAAKAGIAAIGLTSGPFDEQRLREAGAIAIFADVAALLEAFDQSPLVAGDGS